MQGNERSEQKGGDCREIDVRPFGKLNLDNSNSIMSFQVFQANILDGHRLVYMK